MCLANNVKRFQVACSILMLVIVLTLLKEYRQVFSPPRCLQVPLLKLEWFHPLVFALYHLKVHLFLERLSRPLP